MNQPKLPKENTPRYQTAGMVARWQPVHLGHAAVLEGLCQSAHQVRIGIGSANEHNLRSPFRLEEVIAMLDLTLKNYDNFQLIPLPDLNDGPRWRDMVREKFGPLDVFFTDNPYVGSLMQSVYLIEKPVRVVPKEHRAPISGTIVRQAIARGEDWRSMLPDAVADYLIQHKLDQRFRLEFGLKTLALETIIHSKE
jgi:nicotinamide-nucleotide adenylyltransferase